MTPELYLDVFILEENEIQKNQSQKAQEHPEMQRELREFC